MKVTMVLASAALAASTAHAVAADDLQGRFDQIAIGVTKAGVVALIGREPDAETSSKTLGISYDTMRWSSAGRTFVVRLIGTNGIDSRVFGTRVCLGLNTDC